MCCHTMNKSTSISLCRICLEDGATIPIFGTKEPEHLSTLYKLSLCLSEKIEDVDGYPRNICKLCLITLNTVCNFIKRYKESCKLLETGLEMVVKKEIVDISDFSCNEHSEVELEIDSIKTEPKTEFVDSQHFVEFLNPLHLKIKKEPKCKLKNVRRKTKKKQLNNHNNRIASSILEGDYVWTGEKWCIRKCKNLPTIKTEVQTAEVPKKSRNVKLNIPKVNKPPESVLCDLCGEVFKNREKLTIHKRKIHLQDSVKCPQCPRICVSNQYLNRHIKRKHTKEFNFVCSVCGKRFVYKGEMSTHYKKIHEEVKQAPRKYPCKLCDKTYACAKSVLIHERSVHTGERPAVCSVCGSSFYHEDYLREHMRLHTGETPFKCPVCGRGYAQRGNMKSHIRHIHRISQLDGNLLRTIKPNYLRLMKP